MELLAGVVSLVQGNDLRVRIGQRDLLALKLNARQRQRLAFLIDRALGATYDSPKAVGVSLVVVLLYDAEQRHALAESRAPPHALALGVLKPLRAVLPPGVPLDD